MPFGFIGPISSAIGLGSVGSVLDNVFDGGGGGDGLGRISSRGSPREPSPRDIEREIQAAVEAQVAALPAIYEAELRYRPQFAQLEADLFKNLLSGRGGLLNYYRDTLVPSAAEIDRAARLGEVDTLREVGPQLSEALRKAASPGTQTLLGLLEKQAIEGLEAGSELTPREQRAAQQSARAAWQDRGLVRSDPAVLDELTNSYLLGRQREDERRRFAGDVLGYLRSVEGDPASLILGRTPSLLNTASGLAGLSGIAQGAGPSLVDPFPSYAGDLYGSNLSAMTNIFGNQLAAQTALEQARLAAETERYGIKEGKEAAIIGGGLGALGRIGGAFALACWVAREVYGPDNPKWLQFRLWLFSEAPQWFYVLYIKCGRRVALWIKNKPRIKKIIRRFMDKKIDGMNVFSRMSICRADRIYKSKIGLYKACIRLIR